MNIVHRLGTKSMEVTYNMEYRRIYPHPSLPSPPSHTHTYTNSIPLDSWSMSRDNTTPLFSLCVDRDLLTIPLGSLCVHRDTPSRQTPNHNFPLNLSPPFRVLCFMLHILQETTRLSLCARQVRGSILRNFCRLVAYMCRIISLRQ